MARVAMIGATGLIGRHVAPGLIDVGHRLAMIGRRASGQSSAEDIVLPIDHWPEAFADRSVDVAISTLGTTWRKAGNWDAFEAIDRTAVVAFAGAAKAAGARQFILVSSVGADRSANNRYLALKGSVESDLAAFDFDRLDVLRPGLLRGPRGNDRRPGERFGIVVSPLVNPLLRGGLYRFRAIDASTVADAIVALTGESRRGRYVHENADLERLASSRASG